jgi:hypothetical protein
MSVSRILAAALGAALLAAPAFAADAKPAGKPIDVVICLDVSSSMEGLIGSAKARLWDVVNDLAKVKPTPRLRVGLYSYGSNEYNKDNGWVRKEVDLTTDLDAVSMRLNVLKTPARAGSDEYVARVCRDAVKDQPWSDDKDAFKVIFVCGNEPASQDPTLKLADVADLAKGKGILINPIFCGPADHPEAKDWKEFALFSGGRFTNIDMDRGVRVVATPLDKELSELSGKLNTTYLAYGKDGKERAKNQAAQDANAEKSAPGVSAARAVSKGGELYRNEAWDLVDRLKSDPKFDVKKVPADELCEEMKKMKPEEREEYVKSMLARREAMQKQIADLSVKREAWLRDEARKNKTRADKVFDEALRSVLREQAAKKGVTIPE